MGEGGGRGNQAGFLEEEASAAWLVGVIQTFAHLREHFTKHHSFPGEGGGKVKAHLPAEGQIVAFSHHRSQALDSLVGLVSCDPSSLVELAPVLWGVNKTC